MLRSSHWAHSTFTETFAIPNIHGSQREDSTIPARFECDSQPHTGRNSLNRPTLSCGLRFNSACQKVKARTIQISSCKLILVSKTPVSGTLAPSGAQTPLDMDCIFIDPKTAIPSKCLYCVKVPVSGIPFLTFFFLRAWRSLFLLKCVHVSGQSTRKDVSLLAK